jgi:alpha-glucosidase
MAMRPPCVVLLLTLLLAPAARGADVLVRAGRLSAEISLDPWQLRFVDRQHGELLREYPDLGPQPSGPLGFRTAQGWAHAVRALSQWRQGGSLSLLLETSDAEGRRMRVEVRSEGTGVISVRAGLEQGADPEVEALGIGWQAPAGERYFGLGEHSNGVDFRGQTVESWSGEGPFQPDERPFAAVLVPPSGFRARDDATYFPMPWLLSSRGYGVLVDNAEASAFRLASDRPDAWSLEVLGLPEGLGEEPAPETLRFRVFAGRDPAGVLARFSRRIGRQPAPGAPWVLGPWHQVGGSLEQRLGQVQKLRDADAPLSVVQTYTHYLPCGDHVARREEERAMTRAMHDSGVAITTYFNPMICTDYEPRFSEAVAAGALTRNADGEPYVYDYFGSRLFHVGQFDFTSPAGVAYYHTLLAEAVEDGYDGWMEDFGEYTPVDSVAADGTPGSQGHNLYPVQYHCAAWAFAAGQRRPIVRFQRSGFTGAAPCAQVVWNGDPSTTWGFDGLASAVKNGLNLGLSGIAIWGSDIGGFHAFFERALSDEMLVRWVQFGAVSGVMRTQRNGVSLPAKVRPQVEDDDQLPNWRRYAKLRTQLYPYLDAAAHTYRRTGLPIMRHLVLVAPDDPVAIAREHDFLFGPDLLAAPVVTEGATERDVYLPEGIWVDFWRSLAFDEVGGGLLLGAPRLLEGRRQVTLPAPLDELPLLVRAGAVLPLLPPDVDTLADYGASSPQLVKLADRRDALQLLAFPRGRSHARFYRHGRLISIERRRGWDLHIRGGGVREFEIQASLASLVRPFAPCSVRWRGRALPDGQWEYDASSGVLRAHLEGEGGRLGVRACPPHAKPARARRGPPGWRGRGTGRSAAPPTASPLRRPGRYSSQLRTQSASSS